MPPRVLLYPSASRFEPSEEKDLVNPIIFVGFSLDALRERCLSWQVWIQRGYAGLVLMRLSTFVSAIRRECGDVAFFAAFSLFFHN
jgi:hypothetical protein